ncbi:hypothetical protein [Tunturiibacter lichenicola]|uniref:hypothetical protein n=1 Tax=Tunturiibacter lichenicola TaxID=2051959 RepID=UPI003D9BF4C1
MLVAAASAKVTAPSMLFVIAVCLTELLEDTSDSLAARLATVLVANLSDELTSCLEDEFSDAVIFVALASFDASAAEEASVVASDAASFDALEDADWVANLSELEVLADNFLFEARFKLAANEAALFEALVSVAAAFVVAFVADPPLAA